MWRCFDDEDSWRQRRKRKWKRRRRRQDNSWASLEASRNEDDTDEAKNIAKDDKFEEARKETQLQKL